MFQPGDDDARGAPGQHFVKHRFFAVGRIVRHADHGLQAGIVQHFGNAGHHLGEDHVRQRRDDDADQIDPLAGQRPGDLVGHVAQAARRLEHPFARGGRDIAPVAQHAADRHFADARGLGDVAQGQGAARVGGVGLVNGRISGSGISLLLAPKAGLVQGAILCYVSANSRQSAVAGDIPRVLQALNPDARDRKGEWWAKIRSPFPFSAIGIPSSVALCGRISAHEGARGPVAQRIERPPPKRKVAWFKSCRGHQPDMVRRCPTPGTARLS